jgi:hypothetical protein
MYMGMQTTGADIHLHRVLTTGADIHLHGGANRRSRHPLTWGCKPQEQTSTYVGVQTTGADIH